MHPTETATEVPSIHGHDVIDMILSADPQLTRVELAAEVSRRFGPDARFHACSSAAMVLDELIAFLLDRQKIAETNGRLSVIVENVCKH